MKATTQSVFGLMITLLIGAGLFINVSGQTTSLVNEQAVKQLRETGEYDSLRAAMADARKSSGGERLRAGVSETQLIVSDGAISDRFGSSIAVSGNTAIIGSPLDNIGANSDQGSAYIFVRSGTTWTQQAKLTAADGAAEDNFGWNVAISGDTIIIGAAFDDVGANVNQGSAYIFVRSGTTWTQQAKLTAADGAADDYLGFSVAISGNTAIIGSTFDNIEANIDQGSAYIFVRSGENWAEQTKLIASDGGGDDYLGASVAVNGNTAIVGSYGDDIGANPDQGSAYVFVRTGTTWTEQAKLTASDGGIFDYFGVSVSIGDDTAIIGCSDDDFGGNTDQGSAYVFVRNGATWTQQAKLAAADGAALDDFGASVVISGNTAVIGSYGDDIGDNENQGSVYIFARSGTTWTQQTKLTASDGRADEDFGYSVAISGNTVIVGSPDDDIGVNVNQGSAYVFDLSSNTPPRAPFDFDGDGRSDVSVFRPANGVWYLQQSLNGFAGVAFGQSGDRIAPADFDGDGRTDVAVFRPSNGVWYLQRSQLGFTGISFGGGDDVPVPADYDADGRADIAVFRPDNGVWYLLQSTAGFTGIAFGASGDVPVAADYDGDGRADLAVFRPSNGVWYLQRSSLGFTGVAFGASGDKPVAADYDGDGKADIAVFRPSNGVWYLQQSTAGFTGIAFGGAGDLPVAADYDGDGRADIAVFRPGNGVWYLRQSTAGFTGIAFGAPGDKPAPNAFVQ